MEIIKENLTIGQVIDELVKDNDLKATSDDFDTHICVGEDGYLAWGGEDQEMQLVYMRNDEDSDFLEPVWTLFKSKMNLMKC